VPLCVGKRAYMNSVSRLMLKHVVNATSIIVTVIND
jgi:hypothetical protein